VNTHTFFHGMITVDFPDTRTYGRDYKAERLEHELRKSLERFDDNLLEQYSEVTEYSDEMTFHWLDDVPGMYRTIETWWNMRQAGKSKADCYLFYCNNVPNEISLEFIKAMRNAFQPYRPPELKPDFELTDEERDDPNLRSAVALNEKTNGAGSES
jgi:hypothetical protein